GTARQCVVCGSALLSRPEDVIRAELMHVLWVLEDVPRWDVSAVQGKARGYVVGRYRQQERLLRAALEERVEPAPRTSVEARGAVEARGNVEAPDSLEAVPPERRPKAEVEWGQSFGEGAEPHTPTTRDPGFGSRSERSAPQELGVERAPYRDEAAEPVAPEHAAPAPSTLDGPRSTPDS